MSPREQDRKENPAIDKGFLSIAKIAVDRINLDDEHSWGLYWDIYFKAYQKGVFDARANIEGRE